jgi:rod shape-determining protein MreC
MTQLFGILYRIRHFFLFLIFQGIAMFLVSKNSVYWDVTFFNSTNSLVAQSMGLNKNVHEFLNLSSINDQLVNENKILRSQLAQKNEEMLLKEVGYKSDSLKNNRFEFIVAKVIKSSINLKDNYITIDKGTKDGLRPGMGVICPSGIVGQIMSCSDAYARISTVLHSKFEISAEVSNKALRKDNLRALGIGKWEGVNPSVISLNTLDRFKPVFKGDIVTTSLQNSIFPPKIMIGRISRISTNSSEAFYDADLRLSTDFSSLVYVYVVNNKLVAKETALDQNSTESQP